MNGENPQKVRPGAWLYWLCAVMVVVGIVIVTVSISRIVDHIRDLGSQMHQAVMPGTETIKLDSAGEYTLYLEHESVFKGKRYSGPWVTDLDCKLKSVETGKEIPVRPSGMSETYALNGRQGVAIGKFDVPKAGEYELSAEYPPLMSGMPAGASPPISQTGPDVVLVVGPGVADAILKPILGAIGGIGAGALLWIAALVIFIVTIIKRGKSKRMMAMGVYAQTAPGVFPPAATQWSPQQQPPQQGQQPPSPPPGQ